MYCSPACQKMDWKCGHKHWCGVAGEVGHDVEIRDTGVQGQGMGMFALRDIKKHERILAERPVIEGGSTKAMLEPTAIAIQNLEPLDGDMNAKYELNFSIDGIEKEDGSKTCGIYLHMSRINHDCLGSVEPKFVQTRPLCAHSSPAETSLQAKN